MGLKQITPGTGSGGGSGDPATDEQLEQIGGVANDAKTLAQSAKTVADNAATKADAAKTAADGYSGQITTATQKADAAKTAADAASAAASAASGKADGVTGTANDAKTKAEAAQSAAATAGTKADAAKTTADGLDARVTAAETKASTAKTAADAATSAAGTASTKADNAKTAADDAKSIAVGFQNRINDVESTQGGYTQLIAEASATANEANQAAQSAHSIASDLADDVDAAVTKANTAKSAADAAATAAAEAKTSASQSATKVTTLRTDVDANTASITALDNRVAAAATKADQATLAANQASTKASDLADDVQAAADAADLANDLIGDLTARVGTNELAIADLQANGGGSAYDDTVVVNRISVVESDVATLKGAAAQSGQAVMMDYLSVWGDSRTAQNWNSAGTAILARGYAFWAEALSGRVRASLKYNFGVSGDSIQQLLDRINNDTANAAGTKPSQVPPSHAVLHIGTNSINAGTTVASCMYQLNQVINWLLGKGHTVYVVSEWPRGLTATGNGMLTADNQKIMYGYAREIRKLARAKKIKVIDCWPAMADPTLSSAQPRLGYLNGDGLHPSIGAGFLTGKLIAKALEENNAHKIAYPPGSQDLYDATSNKEGALNTNPMLAGTGGTKATNATGDVPDAWTLTPSSGLSVTSSKVTLTMPDGTKREATRLVISGTPAANGSVMLRVPNTTRANTAGVWYGKINDGDVLEGWAEIQVSGDFVNMSNVTCNLVSDTTALSALGGTYTSGSTTGDLQWPDNLKQGYSAIIRSPELTVGSSHTTFQFEVRAYFLEAIASSLTVDILTAGVRKKTNLA